MSKLIMSEEVLLIKFGQNFYYTFEIFKIDGDLDMTVENSQLASKTSGLG